MINALNVSDLFATQDGEVDEFMLRDIEEVAELVRDTTQFKPNCALVIIDFLVRESVHDIPQ